MKTVEEEIEELKKLELPELFARYQEVFGREPRVKDPEWIWKRIAWKLQEIQYGGLSKVAKKRLEELIATIHLPLPGDRPPERQNRKCDKPRELAIGTVLTRHWKGREIRVRVIDQGYEWNNTRYKSLTALAEMITGSHWNGRIFFGLRSRKKLS